MLRLATISLLALITFIPSAIASGCYSQTEAEAEQGIRIHSELMVIGLNCQHMGMRAGQNLYGDYRKFTADYANLFAAYEATLMDYFERNGSDPVSSLNTLRTNVANKISNDAAAMRPDVFCSTYAPRITKAKTMSESDVKKWAATFYPSHPVSRPICAGG